MAFALVGLVTLCVVAIPVATVALRFGADSTWADRDFAPDLRLGAGFAVALTLWTVVSELVVKTHHLTPRVVWTVALTTALVFGSILMRTWRTGDPGAPTPARHAHRLRNRQGRRIRYRGRQRRHRGGSRRDAARRGLFIPVVVSLAAGFPQLLNIIQRPDFLPSGTPWYYWAISRQMALTGGIPAEATEWGTDVSAFTLHLGFNAATAVLATAQHDPGSLAAAQMVRTLVVLTFGIGVWCLARVFGSSRVWATIAVVLASTVETFVIKLGSFRAEPAAYGLALIAVALFVAGMRLHARGLLIASVIAMCGVNQLHGITATFLVALLAGAGAAYVLLGDGTGGEGSRSWKQRFVSVGGFALIAACAAGSLNFALLGRVTPASEAGGLPPLGAHGYDETWALNQLLVWPDPLSDVGFKAPTNRELAWEGFTVRLGTVPEPASEFILLSVIGAGLIGALRYRSLRAPIAFALLAILATVVVAAIVSSTGDTYVPRRTGYRRIIQLWPVIPAAMAGPVLSVLRHSRFGRAFAFAFAVLCVPLAISGFVRVHDLNVQGLGPDDRTLAAVRQLPIPAGSTLLTNAYSQGFISMNTAGLGLFDARAPYQQHGLLRLAIEELTLAREYFADPSESPFPFKRFGVDYVLAATRKGVIANSPVWSPEMAASLAQADTRLRPIARRDAMTLYRVEEG